MNDQGACGHQLVSVAQSASTTQENITKSYFSMVLTLMLSSIMRVTIPSHRLANKTLAAVGFEPTPPKRLVP